MKKTGLLSPISLLFVLCIISCVPDTNNPGLDGTWSCSENSSVYGQSVYDVIVNENSSNSNEIIISNFHQLGENINATATLNGNSILISQQTLPGGFTISGSGTVSNDYKRMDMQYLVTEIPAKMQFKSGSTESVTAVYTKK